MWLLRPHGMVRLACGCKEKWFVSMGAQEEMVTIALAEEQLWWLHRACIAQDRGRPCKEELVHDHANRNQHTN
eukprot:scaffold32142_cov71-Phaeocystis_antarctica.AAC.4